MNLDPKPPLRTLEAFDALQSRGVVTEPMRRAVGEYREALEQMQRSIERASDEKERETLIWLCEQFDQQGVQRLMREAKESEASTCEQK
jgi:hypothetical protein